MRSRSSAVRYLHRAGEAYVSRAIIVASATSCRAGAGMPRDRRVFRAYIDDEHDPKMWLTSAEIDSFSVTVMPRIFIEVTLVVPVMVEWPMMPCSYVLHWLPVPLRIEFKISLLVYKSLHGAAPGYLRDYCKEMHSSASRLRLRAVHRPRRRQFVGAASDFIRNILAIPFCPYHFVATILSLNRFNTSFDMCSVQLIFSILRHTFISKASNLMMSSFLTVLISAQYKVTLQISVFTIRFSRHLHSSQSSPW